MNKFKEVPEKGQSEQKKSRLKKPNKIARSVLNVFSGSFLSKDYVALQLPFILFLTLIGLGYISNGFLAEKSVREISHLNNRLKELKSEFISSKSELMFMSNQTEVAKSVSGLGLKESTTPPKKIVVKINQKTDKK